MLSCDGVAKLDLCSLPNENAKQSDDFVSLGNCLANAAEGVSLSEQSASQMPTLSSPKWSADFVDFIRRCQNPPSEHPAAVLRNVLVHVDCNP